MAVLTQQPMQLQAGSGELDPAMQVLTLGEGDAVHMVYEL